MVKSFSGYLQD